MEYARNQIRSINIAGISNTTWTLSHVWRRVKQRNRGSSRIAGTKACLHAQEITNTATYLCYAMVGSMIGLEALLLPPSCWQCRSAGVASPTFEAAMTSTLEARHVPGQHPTPQGKYCWDQMVGIYRQRGLIPSPSLDSRFRLYRWAKSGIGSPSSSNTVRSWSLYCVWMVV
jgi:hypothetical protein